MARGMNRIFQKVNEMKKMALVLTAAAGLGHGRDRAHAGKYIYCLGVLVAGVAYCAVVSTTTSIPETLFDWLASSSDRSEPQHTRLSIAVANAREIREALAKPISGPAPLPPITAKLAFGHLKPGAKGYTATGEKKPRLPKNGLDAMATGASANSFKASSAVIPEMHKVY